MLLVAIAALIFFFIQRNEREKRSRIARAVAIIYKMNSNADLRQFIAKLGQKSADGQYQIVEFNRLQTKSTWRVTIPIDPDGTGKGIVKSVQLPGLRPSPTSSPTPGTPLPFPPARPGTSPTNKP
jgi:hypothetical protein